jgi:hypothetical protein
MDIEYMFEYLTTTPTGLVVLSISSSMIGALLLALLKRVYKFLLRRYNRYRFSKWLVRTLTYYSHGYRTAYAQHGTTALQAFWAANYVMDYIKGIAAMLSLLLLLVIFLIILPTTLFWLPIVVISPVLSIKFLLLKRQKKLFNMGLNTMFGEKFLKAENERYNQYIESLLKDGKEK